MKTNERSGVIGRIARQSLVFVTLLAPVLLTASFSQAQSSATSTAAPATKPALEPVKAPALQFAKPPAKGHHEGIIVHGHWAIEVKNTDGSVASHHEFENTIAPYGADDLTGLLSGQYVPGGFYVSLTGSSLLCNAVSYCYLFDTRNTSQCNLLVGGPACGSLTYTPNLSSAGATLGFTLTGSLQPTAGASTNFINAVASGTILCTHEAVTTTGAPFSTTTPLACGTGNAAYEYGKDLTGTTIAQIPVISGQSVSVTVTISFGSGN
jgi:hypothetical protein